jgi:serine/threonine-protein kinase
MDEFLVTNQQFIVFLNRNLSKLSFESGVVKGDGANWFFLGEVHAGYEPIIFRDENFHLSDPAYASTPVLRVTGYGASAFAAYFGRRLSTEVELLFVMTKGLNNSPINTEKLYSNSNGENMMGDWCDWGGPRQWPTRGWEGKNASRNMNTSASNENKSANFSLPSTAYIPNAQGARRLNAGFGEWGLKSLADSSEYQTKVSRYAVIGMTEGSSIEGSLLPKVVARLPWEGFEEVGFRTVENAEN